MLFKGVNKQLQVPESWTRGVILILELKLMGREIESHQGKDSITFFKHFKVVLDQGNYIQCFLRENETENRISYSRMLATYDHSREKTSCAFESGKTSCALKHFRSGH
jgi:hypothetical protein